MYTLSRNGRFYGRPTGPYHCGPDHNARWYDYSYEISVYSFGLDQHNFVVDNMAPQQWFDTVGQSFDESCELLARRACYEFASWCRYPAFIRVCVVGFDTATAEFYLPCQGPIMRAVYILADYLYVRYWIPLTGLHAWQWRQYWRRKE